MEDIGLKLTFQINCDITHKPEEVYIIGNTNEFGNWDKHKFKDYQKLNCIKFPLWQSVPILFDNKHKLEYKFIIKNPFDNDENKINWELEDQGNRELDISDFKDCSYLIDEGKFNDKSTRVIKYLDEKKNIEKKKETKNEEKNDKKQNENCNFSIRKGLANIGATCYMNATLQCFLHINNFINYFKTSAHMINYDKTNTLAYSFKKLIDELLKDNNNNQNYVSPYEFKEKLSKMNKLFKGVAANDSKDLVNFIIMQLHQELNKAKKKNNINNNKILDQRNEELVRKNFIKNFKAENQSIISDLFYAMNSTITACGMCGTKLYNYQIYFFLVFPLEEVRKFKYQNNANTLNNINNNEVSIFDCFNYETKTNWMIGDNSMYCNYCKFNTNSTMTTKLTIGPNVLILLLNRGKGIQFNVKILFEEILDLKNYIVYQNTGYMYKLIGVIPHIGVSGMGGHFIAYCRDPKTEQWNSFNDAIVKKVEDFKKEVIDYANPYLLFYQKIM